MNIDSRELAARREWLELSRKQIAEYAGISVSEVDLLEVGKEVAGEAASAYERSINKIEFRRMFANMP